MKKCIIFISKRFMELLTKISPRLSCSILYIIRTHELPHYKKPRNFNDKTTILKLNDYQDNELVIKCTDKYEVRKYIENLGYSNILNELYGVYNSFEEIDFNKIPNKFALKCTHGCAYNIICNDKKKLDIAKTKKKIDKFMKEKYGYATSELHYLKIKPRIICERYLCDENDKMPMDYKIYCFNGIAKCILVCSERDTVLKLNMYDLSWNELPYIKEKYTNKKSISKPLNLKKMLRIAEDLSKPFPFVRVDLYNDNGKIIFGELTFTPACCCAPYYSKIGNNVLESYIGSKSLEVQVMLSMMNQKNPQRYIEMMNVSGDYVIINQLTNVKIQPVNTEDNKRKIISLNEKGLSQSRNLAIKNCMADIGIISDDDMYYTDDYKNIILNSYKKYPQADIIAFVVEHDDKKNEKRIMKEGKIGRIKSLTISSVQITMRLESIKKKNMVFDKNFGSGNKYYMGEENIFLYDCLKNKLKIYYVPIKIGTLRVINESSWFKGYTEEYFRIKGAVFYRMSKVLYIPLILQFAIRKRKLYNNNMSIIKCIKNMIIGTIIYKKEVSGEKI